MRRKSLARSLEKCGWALLFVSMIASVSRYAPPYNLCLGSWALYTAYHPKRRIALALAIFLVLSTTLDVVWVAIYGYEIHMSLRDGVTLSKIAHNCALAAQTIAWMVKVGMAVVAHQLSTNSGHRSSRDSSVVE